MAEKASAKPDKQKAGNQKKTTYTYLGTKRVSIPIARNKGAVEYPVVQSTEFKDRLVNRPLVFKVRTPVDVVVYHRIKIVNVSFTVQDSVFMLATNSGYRYSVNYKATTLSPFAVQGIYLNGKIVGPQFMEEVQSKDFAKIKDLFEDYKNYLSIRNGANTMYMVHPEGWTLKVYATGISISQASMTGYISVYLSLVPLNKYPR